MLAISAGTDQESACQLAQNWRTGSHFVRASGVSDVRFALIGPIASPAEPALCAREAAHRHLLEMATGFGPKCQGKR
jgi:hypothetical protein